MLAMSLSCKAALCLCLLVALAYADEACDKSKCKGPIKYYEELKCKPVYNKPGDCCAVKYDCSHLESRTADKCYANGKEYSVGDQLKDEDRASPCDIGCRCVNGYNDVARFTCAAVDCFFGRPKEGCYMTRPADHCCSVEYCPKEGEEVETCEVDGKTYREGESFYPEGKSDLSCTCMKDFKGELVEPFCRNSSCGTEMRRSAEIYSKCAPVYYHKQSPVTGCSIGTRCPNDKDKVIKATEKSSGESSGEDKSDKSNSDEQAGDMKCIFGNMTMELGDELNQATNWDSVCVKCVCEVPPTPTCGQLGSDECDMSKHPDFDN